MVGGGWGRGVSGDDIGAPSPSLANF